ncbi:MAG: 4Fe-4S binding protein [Thaumarchaeota archaeon]|nr:4Fe-4S binding protein [Nitrososphaerota archaeon]
MGDCVTACPTSVIEIRGVTFWRFRHIHAVLAHPEKCTGCGRCVEVCPVQAWSFPRGDNA